MTALTTARDLVHNVLPYWGTEITFISDKGPAFVSQLFKHINELLGINHITSGTRNSRPNGIAEAYVKRFSEFLNIMLKTITDYTIEEVIPLIEIILRATPQSKLMLSPYQIVYGQEMPLVVLGKPASTTDVQLTDYYYWYSAV